MKKIDLPPANESGEPDISVSMNAYYTEEAQRILTKLMHFVAQRKLQKELNEMQQAQKEQIAEIVHSSKEGEGVSEEGISKLLMYIIATGYHKLRLLWMADNGVKEKEST